MNTAQNIFLPAPVTADDITAFKAAAANEYGNAKSSAMKSAANAYLVWHHAESAHAMPDMRDWLDGEIDKANTLIEAHNKAVDHEKNRAKLCSEKKLNETISDEEQARLLALHERKPSEWAKEKQVKVEGRSSASTFTRIVKFVFGFVRPADASHVSRYAKALEYIEQHKNDLNGDLSVEAIVRLLERAGGFEAAVEAMRGNSTATSDIMRSATLLRIKQEVANVADGEEIALESKHACNGYVFLVGRTTATGVMVCGELAINDNEEADKLLLKIDGDVIGDPAPAVAFISQAVSIGRLVGEGRASNIVDTAGSGEAFKVKRAYSMLKSAGSSHLVISARYAEASLIVHAHPKAHVDLGALEQGQAIWLDDKIGRDLAAQFGDPAGCRLLKMEVEQGDDAEPVRWAVSMDVDGAQSKNFAWSSMFGQAHLPLNIRGYEPDCTINLSHDQIRELHDAYLVQWGAAKADDKDVRKPLTVAFDGVDLSVGHVAFGKHVMAVGKKKGAQVTLLLRPRDIVDMFKKLLELNVQECSVSGDCNGMLEISWADTVGNYSVYVPALEGRGSLSKSCIGYIKPTK